MAAVERRTLSEQVFDALRTAILEDRYPPGTELQEVALAEAYGVSRGPIREALGRLSAEGLVTIRPRRGAEVTALTKQEFLEAYEVREALEVLAISLAVARADRSLFVRLRDLLVRMDEAADRDDVDEFFSLNSAFHRTFVEMSGNSKLAQVHGQVVGSMGRYRRRSLALRGDLRPSVEEHRQILAAVEARDAQRAAELLAHHIRVPRERLGELSEAEFSGAARPALEPAE